MSVKGILDIVLPDRKGKWLGGAVALFYVPERIIGIDNGIAAPDYQNMRFSLSSPLKKTKNKKAVEEISTTARKKFILQSIMDVPSNVDPASYV